MIDNIKIIKRNLSEIEINKVVKKSHLLEQSVNGLKSYNNGHTKNFNGGLFIKIDTHQNLKITGSLHKYHSFLKTNRLTNFDAFTMPQAKETILQLIDNIGFEPLLSKIVYYEIGLNLVINIEPNKILQNVLSIGNLNTEKAFYFNARYKQKTHVNTLTHRDFRIYHKMYDKIFEMIDNRKLPPVNKNIIRIETVNRRIEKTFLSDFINDENLNQLQTRFFNHWNGLNFHNDIEAPPGTHKSKIELAKEIIYTGKNEVLKKYYNQYKNGVLSMKMYYSIKRFVENWETDKFKFVSKKSQICAYWEKVYNTEKQLYTGKILIE